MPTWDAAQYLRFEDERTRPARDLLARVPLEAPARIVDLGCGPGNSTALLRARWPQAQLAGVDSSAEMLATARQAQPELDWIQADIAAWRPEAPLDLVYSNATMQWLPDHARLFPRLLEAVAEGGVLAVQMPHNYEQPSHALMREVGRSGPWKERVASARLVSPVADAGFYYELLAPRCAHIELWETTYFHVMDNAEAVLEWTRGSGLRPFLEALEAEERTPFEALYLEALRGAYTPRADGKLIFPFPRLFMVAMR